MKILKLRSRHYPALLREIFDPPAQLYVEGETSAWERPCVAVVGTRRCTPYGEALAFEIGRELARAGVCVVSGLAFGIDAAAHQGALEAGGVTAGVVAQALPNLLPAKHRSLARAMVSKGGVILSEKAPGEKTYKGDYLVRNRIVAGLCQAIVVVEAGFPSGALNTAKHAREQNREVFAVPGRLTDPFSAGCNDLLAQGAHVFLKPQDVLDLLGLKTIPRRDFVLSELEKKLLLHLQGEALHASELAEKSAVDLSELYEILTHLEMQGVLRLSSDLRYTVC